MSDFISVADVASLPPGKGRSVHVHGRVLALWNLKGEFFCIDDACPHRGESLGAGRLEKGTVYCPMHGWGFEVKTGICALRPDRPVKTYPTRVVDGQVQVQLPPIENSPSAVQ